MCFFIYVVNEKWKLMGFWFFFLKFIGKFFFIIFFMYDFNKNVSWGILLDCLIVIDEFLVVKYLI